MTPDRARVGRRPAIASGLLDARTGIVAGIEQIPVREPWHLYQAAISEPRWQLRPNGGRVAAGCSLDRRQAEASAIGEAVERYCSMHADPRRLHRSNHQQLSSRHERAIDPRDLQLARARSDAVLTPQTECDWVQGQDRHGPCWVPAALTWTEPGPQARTGAGRPYCAPHSQGVALASTRAGARHHALGEVIERHALATVWHLGIALPELGTDGDIHCWLVPNRWHLPVVLAAIVEPGWIAAGSAVGDSIANAAEKAGAEAVMMCHTLALAADDDSPWATGPVPHRAAEALDLHAHAALCRQPAVRRRQLDRLGLGDADPAPPVRPPAWADPPPHPNELRDVDPETALIATGLEPVTVDLTTTEVAEAGWTVVRVVVPGLRGTAPAGYIPPGHGIDPLPPAPDLTPIPVM
ncbi:MAG: YcaO-like family protein [Acidimicrobiales bacterium]